MEGGDEDFDLAGVGEELLDDFANHSGEAITDFRRPPWLVEETADLDHDLVAEAEDHLVRRVGDGHGVLVETQFLDPGNDPGDVLVETAESLLCLVWWQAPHLDEWHRSTSVRNLINTVSQNTMLVNYEA